MSDKQREVTIRPSRGDDTDRLVEITIEVFGPLAMEMYIEKMLGRGQAGWEEIKAQEVRKELADNPGGCFVAEVDGKLGGYVTTIVRPLASRGWIPNVAVATDCQGLGVGRMLLEKALEHFRGLGLAQAKIETLASNPVGQHLYPSLGFREAVRQIHYVMSLK